VRSLRHERGLTLKALGRLAGLSHPFLSQVERGLARPSMASVERIAAALDVPVAQLWAPPRSRDVAVLRHGEGAMAEQDAMLRELSTAVREWSAGGRRWPTELETHAGEVLIYVARGAVEVDLDGTVHVLDEGDALRFDGSIPHRLRRIGAPGTRAIIATA
jgi:transcriptional regulator with XRE-family HTH domain